MCVLLNMLEDSLRCGIMGELQVIIKVAPIEHATKIRGYIKW